MASDSAEVTAGLSVLICTHNPKERNLRRTLEALERQSLARDCWELLLVDNRSSSPIEEKYDLSWHPRGRQLSATILGKTHAIAEALKAATEDVLVIVDDDNVLADDYLQLARQAFLDHPFVGAAGGVLDGEYESRPDDWMLPYLVYLAVFRRGNLPCYAFTPDDTLVCPGAGMVIRKQVIAHYLHTIANDPARLRLDPVGDRLSRAGDTDMMLCAYDVGLAKAFFPQLRLTHLIPSERLSLDYMVRLREEGEYCDASLRLIRGLPLPPMRMQFVRKCREILRESWRMRKVLWQRFRVEWAALQGQRRARRSAHVQTPANSSR